MFNNVVLDVFIGLIFIYLLYSLLATIVQEIIATHLAFRAKILEKAILRMLEDGKTTTIFPYFDRVRGFLHMIFRVNWLKNKKFAAAFYGHPLMKYLAEDNWYSKPTYLSAKNFSRIMVDLLQGIELNSKVNNFVKIQESLMNGNLKLPAVIGQDQQNPANKALEHQKEDDEHSKERDMNVETQLFLQSLWMEAQGDVEKFKLKLEQWFDDTMERATGWYKRYVQVLLFFIGLIIAIAFNVDSIAIGKKLSKDPALREQMVQHANAFLEQHQQLGAQLRSRESMGDTTTALYKRIHSNYDSLQVRIDHLLDSADAMIKGDIADVSKIMGLGWKKDPDHTGKFFGFQLNGFLCFRCNNIGFFNVIGWILTALAISLGAPFWFDLLNKIMKVRGSGNKVPPTSDSAGTSINQPLTINVKTTSGEEAVG